MAAESIAERTEGLRVFPYRERSLLARIGSLGGRFIDSIGDAVAKFAPQDQSIFSALEFLEEASQPEVASTRVKREPRIIGLARKR